MKYIMFPILIIAIYLVILPTAIYAQDDFLGGLMDGSNASSIGTHKGLDPRITASLSKLGDIFGNPDKLDQAGPLLQQLSGLAQQMLKSNGMAKGGNLNLGALLQGSGNMAGMDTLLKGITGGNGNIIGAAGASDNMNTTNKAASYQQTPDPAQTEAYLKHMLAVAEKQHRSNSLDVAADLDQLAMFYFNQGRCAEAKPLITRMLAIHEKNLGSNHPAVAADLNNLGALLYNQGKYSETEPLYKRALAIRANALGPEHPDVAITLQNYAILLRAVDRNSEAAALEQRAQESRTR